MFEFEIAGEEQEAVADFLSGEAAVGAAAEEAIFGIGEGAGGLGFGGELVGAAEDDLADEGFEGAAAGAEFGGEVVEEGGVGGFFALGAEVVDGADEAAAEELSPEAVDDDSVEQGVVGAGDPVGELEAAAGAGRDSGGGAGVEDAGEAAGDLRCGLSPR